MMMTTTTDFRILRSGHLDVRQRLQLTGSTEQANRLHVGCAYRVAIETAVETAISDDYEYTCVKFHLLCSLLSSNMLKYHY